MSFTEMDTQERGTYRFRKEEGVVYGEGRRDKFSFRYFKIFYSW